MKWIKSLTMAAGAIGMAAGAAQATPVAVTGTFDMNGGMVGHFADVTGTYDSTAATWSVASPSLFFGHNWTAHNGTLLHPGHVVIDTIEGGVYSSFTINPGEVGGHILFDWNNNYNIDVLMIWDANGNVLDSDSTGVPGIGMIDGPFVGFEAAFTLRPNAQVSGPVVPEPMSMALVGSSLLGLAGLRRKFQA